HAGGRGLPRGRQPRDPPRRPGPQAGLAGRELREGARRPRAGAADRADVARRRPPRAADPGADVGRLGRGGPPRAPGRGGGRGAERRKRRRGGGDARGAAAMKALMFTRSPARYAAAMVAGSLRPGRGARYGPLTLRDIDPPELPGPDWLALRPRLAGICGSDL